MPTTFLKIAFYLLLPSLLGAQDAEYVYLNPSDSLHDAYLVVPPQGKEVKALLIRDYSRLPDVSKKSPYQINRLCAQAGIMILYTQSSPYFPELFCADSIMENMDVMVTEVIQRYQIPKQNIFTGGISASGTRALRYAIFCAQGKSALGLNIKGVFAVDAPLDQARFYQSVHQNKKHFKGGMLWEAELMEREFKRMFPGSPEEFPQAYIEGSVFSAGAKNGGMAQYLLPSSILFFQEPDMDWWLPERGAAYFDINSYDLTACTQMLQSLGHTDVQLITSSKQGYDKEGERNCHSWTIVDEGFLVNWIRDRID
jgi:hypothetical protein